MTIPRIDGLDKNYLINGGFDFSQRFPLISIAPLALDYRPDRWLLQRLGTWDVGFEPAFQRDSLDTPSLKSKYSARFDTMKATNGTAALVIQQRIESFFSRSLANKNVSLSLKYKGTTFQNLELKLETANSEDNHASTTNFFTETKALNVDGTQWRELKFENISVPSNGINGIKVNIEVKNPDTFSTEFSWYIGEIKLNIGTKAQEFSLAGRDYAEELQLCQRYYEKSYNLEATPGTVGRSGIVSGHYVDPSQTSTIALQFEFKVQKRNIPVMVFYSPGTGSSNQYSRYNSGAASSGTITSQANVEEGERGVNGYLNTNVAQSQDSDYQVHWTADAEL